RLPTSFTGLHHHLQKGKNKTAKPSNPLTHHEPEQAPNAGVRTRPKLPHHYNLPRATQLPIEIGHVPEITGHVRRNTQFGVVLPLKAEVVRRQARNHLEELPGYANTVIGDLLSEVSHLDERIKQYDTHIRAMARDCTAAQQLM